MKKTASLFFCLLMLLCMCTSALAIGSCDKEGTNGEECNLYYKHISGTTSHELYCSAHDDAVDNSTSSCDVGGDGVCKYCHCDYTPNDSTDDDYMDPESLEAFMRLLNSMSHPVDTSVSGASATVALSAELKNAMLDQGFGLSEALASPCILTLTLPDGDSYPYTGLPVEPNVKIQESNPELIEFLEEYTYFYLGGDDFTNHVLPGTATVSAHFSMGEQIRETFSLTFEIVEGAVEEEHCFIGNANGEPCSVQWLTDAQAKTHQKICTAHKDIGSPYDYVSISYAYDCILGQDLTCAVCGYDYADAFEDVYDTALQDELNRNQLPVWAGRGDTRASAIVKVYSSFRNALKNGGYPITDDMENEVNFTLTLSGASFPYTGEPITPDAEVVMTNANSLVTKMIADGFITISDISFFANQEVGTATAQATISINGNPYTTMAAQFTIIDGSGDSVQYIDQSISSGDIHLHGALTPDARLIVTPIGTGHSDYQKLAAHDDAKGREMIAAYDVSVLGDYRGQLELMFPVDEQYKDSEITVLHGKGDGLVESHTVTVTENVHGACVIIRVDSLSPFMLLGEKAEATPTPVPAVTAAPTQAPEATTAPGGSVTAAPTATLTPTETPGAVELPATGDSSQLALWMALLLVSCIGVVLLNAAKRTGRQ